MTFPPNKVYCGLKLFLWFLIFAFELSCSGSLVPAPHLMGSGSPVRLGVETSIFVEHERIGSMSYAVGLGCSEHLIICNAFWHFLLQRQQLRRTPVRFPDKIQIIVQTCLGGRVGLEEDIDIAAWYWEGSHPSTYVRDRRYSVLPHPFSGSAGIPMMKDKAMPL